MCISIYTYIYTYPHTQTYAYVHVFIPILGQINKQCEAVELY